MDWISSCNMVARNNIMSRKQNYFSSSSEFPVAGAVSNLVTGNRPSMVYDANCLQRHRLTIQRDGMDIGTIAYYATEPLRNQNDGLIDRSPYKKTIIIQHGAFRDADVYYCLMQQLVYDAQQNFKYNFSEVLVIAPNFNYKTDYDVYTSDAFFNITKVGLNTAFKIHLYC
jgi:hypothetical protein